MRQLKPQFEAIHFAFLVRLGGLILLATASAVDGIAQTPSIASVGREGHCSEISGNPGNEILACLVWDRDPERFSEPQQIEIYRKDQKPKTIEPGGVIREWHFTDNGTRLAIHFGTKDTEGIYTLYDTETGGEVERVAGRLESDQLPQWAKSQSQLQDESVPEGSVYAEQRTQWIAKLLRRLDSIHPGMKRKELDLILGTEGGIWTRLQRTYVSRECPFIKIDVRFRSTTTQTESFLEEDPDDVIESRSRPYLAWSVMD